MNIIVMNHANVIDIFLISGRVFFQKNQVKISYLPLKIGRSSTVFGSIRITSTMVIFSKIFDKHLYGVIVAENNDISINRQPSIHFFLFIAIFSIVMVNVK